MGRNGNRLHGNGREWECKKPFPGISSAGPGGSHGGGLAAGGLHSMWVVRPVFYVSLVKKKRTATTSTMVLMTMPLTDR